MLCSPQLLLPSLAVLLYGGGVIDRYTRPEMGRIWSEESKYQAWLRVELAVCEAYARRGRIPADAMARIRQRARVDVARILVIQERVKHEMIALLTSLEEQVGEDSRFIHIGLTTSDVWDTATALQLRDAVDLLIEGQERLEKALGTLALRHKDTLIIGRTHGVHAEPTTFGLKVAVWYTEAGRNLERLRRARATISVGKLSGAVGNFAHVEPDLEAAVCRELGLDAAPVSTQIVQRDRHAEFCAMLAVAAASLEKIALEVRGLQRTEILEAQEPFLPLAEGLLGFGDPRSPGALRRGAERLERHAAQAQPGAGRAHLRPGAPGPHQCARGPRKRRPVARAGYQPFLGRARHPARLDDHARLSSVPHDVHRRGARRRSRADEGESRAEPRPRVLAACAVEADRCRARTPGRVRDCAAQRHARLERAPAVLRAPRSRSQRDAAAPAGRAQELLRSGLLPEERRRHLQTPGAHSVRARCR